MTLLVAAVGALAFYLPRHGAASERLAGSNAQASQGLTAEVAARTEAVTWILRQASRAAVVSCDPQVCANLVSGGFPSANLLTLEPTSNDPLGSTLVVATAAVRAQFGPRLASVYAPAIIASFGSGSARIDIRLVFPGGAASYGAAAQTALRARKAADAQLLANSQVVASAAARAQLLAALSIRGFRSSSPSWPKTTRCASWTSLTSRLAADLPACCGRWIRPPWSTRST